jgi:pyruvate dehydrogenase E2 component (dihydrolipoamide acetyltransferase)
MAEIIKMPKLSDTMTEGVVAEWHKKVGDTVKTGDVLAEIETDKATMEFEAFQEGVLLHIGVQKGEAAPVDTILAILGKKGENIDSLLKEEVAAESQKNPETTAPESSNTPATVPNVSTAVSPVSVSSDGRLKVSPLARKLAEEKGVDLSLVSGSGEGGRIVKRDIDSFQPAKFKGFVGQERYTEQTVSQMRKTIAGRLSQSKFTAPHFYLTMDIDMDAAIAARKAINASGELKISFNDLVIKAAAAALRKHPAVNSSWLGDKIRFNEHIHIGVAVAVPEGLLVPVVRFADGKDLATISTEVRGFAQKAKDKKLQPQDWEGNTFTISNLGMFGIEEFTAIINPPDACIMAVGAIRQEPVVKEGQVMPGNRMKVTLSCDHRVVDGATGAAFLQTFKNYLEVPVMMFL